MLQLNTVYSIDNGANSVIFTEGKKGSITGTHNEGTLTGFLEGNILKGTFHNSKVNASGLIEITFHENGFDAKWKQGMEPGPMRGKWQGLITSNSLLKNATFDIKSPAQKYLEFISKENAYDKQKIAKCSPEKLIEVYSCEYDEKFFNNLNEHIDILRFRIDNSEYSIDEKNGADRIDMVYDLVNNCIYAQFDDADEEIYQYLQTKHASIPEFYEDQKEFYGCYSVSDLNRTWELYFHGSNLERIDGEISEDLLLHLKTEINSKTIYSFLTNVIDWF
jgi:hypothetical protein